MSFPRYPKYKPSGVDNKIRLFPCWPADQDAASSCMVQRRAIIS